MPVDVYTTLPKGLYTNNNTNKSNKMTEELRTFKDLKDE